MKKRSSPQVNFWLLLGVLTSCFATLSFKTIAQTAPVIQWDKTFGGSGFDELYSIQQTADGGYILGGSSDSGLSGDKSQSLQGTSDIWIVKLDANGNKIWDKTFGGNDYDILGSLQITADGGYLIAGTSDSDISGDKSQPSQGYVDYWIIKLDASGNKLWDKVYGGNTIDVLTSALQTADGGYILSGFSDSNVSGDKTHPSRGRTDYWIVKLDLNGNKLWDRTFGGTELDDSPKIKQTADGGYILGGNSTSPVSGDKSENTQGAEPDYWVLKLDNAGNKIWDRTFGGGDEDLLYSIQQTSDGSYLLGGSSKSGVSGNKVQPLKGSRDYWLIKLNNTGTRIWEKSYGGLNNNFCSSIQQTADGGYILGGWSDFGIGGDKTQMGRGNADFWIIKLDTSGTKLWDKAIGGSDIDNLLALQQTSDGGYILGGISNSQAGFDKTSQSKGLSDYWVVKLGAEITGFNEAELTLPIAIFPNPNAGKFNLQLSRLTSSTAEVSITDLLGRTVLHKEFKFSDNQLLEEISIPYTKGMYLLHVKTGNRTATRKISVE
ncbi:T9SS type A sorting domain-containing protein [Adhaeribacter soli]|uniref:T9SS type A sorting domain-containing protein n=1 Tax=Adhaeribacter soli TaxID=2607655 RepID=A0A5N1J4D6_9BACT|nr:T9SS type A sorting domain-containing protein [Adhaeribacter soli]KAA9345550.1 T9SS type A sorting domain-containing protein [Adhaeribacter soli]